jgi:hypothetical protein
MNTRILLKLSGFAALAGGILRIASAAQLPLGPTTSEALWDLIDVLLVFGLIGIYLSRAEKLGFLGLAAFACAMASLSFIGGPDADVFGFSTYEQGAAALAISMVGFALAWLRAGERPLAPPLLWFASVLAVGVLGLLPAPAPAYGLKAAGALFGLAFAAAGWDLLRRAPPVSK